MDNNEINELEIVESEDQAREGYLYIMHAEGTNYIKIGQAQDVLRRRGELQVGCPQRLTILLTVPSSDAPALEQLMHDHFAAYRLHGDWFALPSEVPTVLELFAFVYRQTAAPLSPACFNAETRSITSARIIALLEEHQSLSISSLLDLLADDNLTANALKVQLHRLYNAGLIGKNGRGVYTAHPEIEQV